MFHAERGILPDAIASSHHRLGSGPAVVVRDSLIVHENHARLRERTERTERTERAVMPETRLSRKLAPRSVEMDLFEQLEKSLLSKLTTLFLVPPGEIEVRFTVTSQDASERSDSVSNYRPKKLPEHVDSVRLFLRYKRSSPPRSRRSRSSSGVGSRAAPTAPMGLAALLEISPLRQGTIVLTSEDDDDSASTKLIGLLHFIENITGENDRVRTLPQPNTLYRMKRIPSCKLTLQRLKALPNLIDKVLAEFLGEPRYAQPDLTITFHTSEGKVEVTSFEQVPPLSEVRNLEIQIRHVERERTSAITIELAPTSRDNTLEIRLVAFGTPTALGSADSVTESILLTIAEHRTLYGLLYWPQPVGIFTWLALLLMTMILVDHGLSALALIVIFLLPFFVVAARKQYPYVSFEPRKRSMFDQVLMVLVSLAVTALVLPWFVSWLAGLLN